jgi:hypothetical protein
MTSKIDGIALSGTARGGTGPDLTGYPHLVYAPGQWGEGVCVASNGAPVASIAGAAKVCGAFSLLRQIADDFEITLDEVCDAIRWDART